VSEGENPRWVYAHGKRILISTLPINGKKTQRKRRLDDAFGQVDLAWAARAAKMLRSPATFMLIYLQYVAWQKKSKTFSLPNTDLRQYGISRQTKSRLLRAFTAKGLISTHHNGHQAVTVTLL
jgi:hypothetical protein